MDAREQAIQSALADLESGVHTSQRQAAKAYGIPRSTLQSRQAGSQPSTAAHAHQQRLTPAEEEFLADWILEEASRVSPPSPARAREMAARVLAMNGDHKPLGKDWLSKFISRNPRVASVLGRKTNVARTQAASPELVRAFLELFEGVRKQLGIRIEDIQKVVGTGTTLGDGSDSQSTRPRVERSTTPT